MAGFPAFSQRMRAVLSPLCTHLSHQRGAVLSPLCTLFPQGAGGDCSQQCAHPWEQEETVRNSMHPTHGSRRDYSHRCATHPWEQEGLFSPLYTHLREQEELFSPLYTPGRYPGEGYTTVTHLRGIRVRGYTPLLHT